MHTTPSRRLRWPREPAVLAAVALGGGVGALARFAAVQLWARPGDAFPWTVLAVNAAGCAAIGVLLVVTAERGRGPALLRPFLGTGVLGGFTTFSAYAVDVERLLDAGRVARALGYLALTPLLALAAVWLAAAATRRALGGAGR